MPDSLLSLPALTAGKKFTTPRPPGSADAWMLARHLRERAVPLALVVVADAADAQRLADEIGWFDPELSVCVFPDWETLPYETFSPHQDLVSERLATLWRIHRGAVRVVIVPATTALQRLAPPEFLAAYTFDFTQGAALDEAALKAQLTFAGYEHVSQVVRPGEYAVRGGLIDVFPMGSAIPYRVDLFGHVIDGIRTFDPDTQRSLYPVQTVQLLPGREFPLDDKARQKFRARFREVFEGDPTKSVIYKDVGNGLAPAGVEYYLPLFFERTATLFEYVGAQALVVLHGDVSAPMQRFLKDTGERYRLLRHDRDRPLMAPEALFLREDEFFTLAGGHAQLVLRGEPDAAATPAAVALPDIAVNRQADDPLAAFRRLLGGNARVLLCAESAGRRETLLEYLREHAVEPPLVDGWAAFLSGTLPFAVSVAPLASGFALPEAGVLVVTETELFALTPSQRRRKRQEQASNVDALIKDLSELNIGDPVVHVSHGIGRYAGLVSLELGDASAPKSEFLHIRYAQDASLYVPVAQMHLVGRYTGVSAQEAPLHALGSGQWEKARKKAAEQVYDT
ncbi:MAG: transcription-repair coupling factor, partial [Betaproteobacteria bacterium]|nr:transcription-repair coupling factor [Betaproteobacteria bacterium]